MHPQHLSIFHVLPVRRAFYALTPHTSLSCCKNVHIRTQCLKACVLCCDCEPAGAARRGGAAGAGLAAAPAVLPAPGRDLVPYLLCCHTRGGCGRQDRAQDRCAVRARCKAHIRAQHAGLHQGRHMLGVHAPFSSQAASGASHAFTPSLLILAAPLQRAGVVSVIDVSRALVLWSLPHLQLPVIAARLAHVRLPSQRER
eukprot:1160453-Pelagomonas_calceolata.AAC.10